MAVEIVMAHGEQHVAGWHLREWLVPGSRPCRGCGCDVRVRAAGWGDRCGCCGNHGNDLEVE